MTDKIKDWLEIKLFQLVILVIRKGYGANCKTKDTDDFKDMEGKWTRCPSCKAAEVVEWMEGHVELIKEYR